MAYLICYRLVYTVHVYLIKICWEGNTNTVFVFAKGQNKNNQNFPFLRSQYHHHSVTKRWNQFTPFNVRRRATTLLRRVVCMDCGNIGSHVGARYIKVPTKYLIRTAEFFSNSSQFRKCVRAYVTVSNVLTSAVCGTNIFVERKNRSGVTHKMDFQILIFCSPASLRVWNCWSIAQRRNWNCYCIMEELNSVVVSCYYCFSFLHLIQNNVSPSLNNVYFFRRNNYPFTFPLSRQINLHSSNDATGRLRNVITINSPRLSERTIPICPCR